MLVSDMPAYPDDHIVQGVLILVLVDVGLGPPEEERKLSFIVLILVLVDVGLGPGKSSVVWQIAARTS